MLLIFHIAIAFLGIIFSGSSLFSPSEKKLKSSYILVAGTFLTGSLLIILKPAHLVQACFSGLVYLGFVGVMIYIAQRKLAKEVAPPQVKY
ncbi:MAG: hypothetical protein Q7T54_05310 [Candidatus Levybacteria bacterium]|nr:hypothetical protein [Candidatus Levybacteria bacterium]